MQGQTFDAFITTGGPTVVIAAVLIGLIVLALKGWALWIAAKNHHKIWFVVLLVLNTIGILELIYIFFVGKKALDAPLTEVKEDTSAGEPEQPKAAL